jgi:hypothetical protein
VDRLVVEGRDVAPLEIARTARARSRGLLGRDGLTGALWLSPARQVHTFRMRFAIDVAHIGKDGTVLHTATMAPGRLGSWVWRSRGVLEAEAGSFDRWGLTKGTTVSFTNPDGGVETPA